MAARKPKYAAVTGKLPKMPLVDPARKELVDAAKVQILTPPNGDDPPVNVSAAHWLEEADDAVQLVIQIQMRATAGRRWAGEFGRVYSELRALKAKIAEWESNVNLMIEAYLSLMIEQMENEGVTSLRLENGQPISTWEEPYCKVEDPEAFRQWCLSDPDLVRKMALNWSVVNSLVKDRLLQGEPEPPGVTAYALKKVRLGSE